MALKSDEGFVISTSDYRESSRIARCFTKEFGKLGIIAKGIRRPKSRIGASLETFAHLKFVFYLKPGANLSTLKEAEALDYFPNLRTDLKRFAIASFFFEILDRGLPARQKNPRIFRLTGGFLRHINTPDSAPDSASPYLLHLIAALGFSPRLERCAVCDSETKLAFFDPADGRIVCERCRTKRSGLIELPDKLRTEMIKALSLAPKDATQESWLPNDVSTFFRIIRRLVEYHFETHLKSAEFLLKLLVAP